MKIRWVAFLIILVSSVVFADGKISHPEPKGTSDAVMALELRLATLDLVTKALRVAIEQGNREATRKSLLLLREVCDELLKQFPEGKQPESKIDL